MSVQTIIHQRPMMSAQVLVVLLCFVLNMIDGMDVVVVSYVAPRIIQEWMVTPQTFGLVLSAALVGMAAGAMVISPYTDVIGRRNMVLLCMAIVSVGMLFTAQANSINQLALLRLFTGLGIGSMLASSAALTYEYASAQRRNLAVSFVLGGYPVGATMTGLLAAWLIPEHGWRAMFYTGSTVSLLLLPVIYFLLPESLEFLLSKQPPRALDRINHILQKLKLELLTALPERNRHYKLMTVVESFSANIRSLFAPTQIASTLKLWVAFFMAFFTLYFLLSWIPKIAEGTGLTPVQGSYAGAVFNIGSFLGTVILGYLSAQIGLKRVIYLFMLWSAVLMVFFGAFRFPLAIFMCILFVLGFFAQGGFVGLYAVAARLYPVEIRTTGIGWGIGVGRIGAILAPVLGGQAIGFNLPVALIFILFALPCLVAGYAVMSITDDNLD